MAASSTGSTENRQIFREFFGEFDGVNQIPDERIDQLFDTIELNFEEKDSPVRSKCLAIAKKIDSVWHLFVGCIEVIGEKDDFFKEHSYSVYHFYKNEKGIIQESWKQYSNPNDSPIESSKRLDKENPPLFFIGMVKHDSKAINQVEDPTLNFRLDSSLQTFCEKVKVPELIPNAFTNSLRGKEKKKLQPQQLDVTHSESSATSTALQPQRPKKERSSMVFFLSGIALVVLLGLAVAWKKGCFPFRSIKPLEVN